MDHRSRSTGLKVGALVMIAAAVAQTGVAHAQTAVQILTTGCADDAHKFCSDVAPGGGRIVACLKQHADSLSAGCKQAAAQVSSMAGGSAPSVAPTVPPAASNDGGSTAKPTRTTTASTGGEKASSGATATGGARGAYLVMKKVKINGPGPDAAHPTVPAVDLMIPSTWKIQGGVTFGGSPSGCFADIFAINLQASNSDESSVFSAAPDSSWQYADDPSVLKSLNDPSRRALGVGGKPCSVSKPIKADEYIRQTVLKLFPSGTTVVSVAPFPELNEIVRKRQGLPPGKGDAGSTRTDAVRARLAYQNKGKDVEAWVAVGIVVNIYPAGSGSFYDSHATSLVALSAPKGQLDANDKLFQVILGSIQPEPQWVSYSNGVLSKLYQAQAQKVANINRMWAQFYTHAAQTINGETANAMRGADASAFHEDQNIRGVQTFRDPATGQTQELSNLYDHAWQNGSNEYIMSNDASFNPNEHLNGNWSQLQAVNP